MRVAPAHTFLRPELAEPGRTPSGEFRVSHLFRPHVDGGLQAYLVRSHSPQATVGTHFHVVDQFQLFVEGSGTFQRHPVGPYTIHYTDAFTTYGPIVAGEDGLSFLVLRREADPGANYMPGAGDRLERRPRRSVSELVALDGETRRSARRVVDDGDGLVGGVASLEPGDRLASVWSGEAGGLGRYLVVLQGSLVVGDEELGPLSCLWEGPGEPTDGVGAGREGCHLAILQFPVPRAVSSPGPRAAR